MDFMNRAYEFLWLSASLPAYVDSKYALAPCNVLQNSPSMTTRSVVEVDTVSYWSELQCRPYFDNFTHSQPVKWQHSPKECGAAQLLEATSIQIEDTTSAINYIPYWHYKAWNQYSERPFLGLDSSCPISAKNDALVLWPGPTYDSTNLLRTNVTAQFCSAKYFSQRVRATLTYPEYKPISTKPLGPSSDLSETMFNTTLFEYLIGLGQSPITLNGDWPNVTAIPQDLKIEELNVAPPFGNMVGFALGNRTFATEDYSNPQILHKAFETAHQLLFALAINQLQGTDTTRTKGTIYGNVRGIVMVPGLAIVVELALALTAVSTLGLLITNWKRYNKLYSDPASLQDFMHFLPEPDCLGSLHSSTTRTSLEMGRALHNQRFKLVPSYGTKISEVRILRMGSMGSETPAEIEGVNIQDPQRMLNEALPWELKRKAGLVLGLVLLLAIIALAVLLQRAHDLGGLPRPSDNIVVRQILLNYVPTIFATILEPTWVLINRLLCIVQPLEALKSCKVPALQSIALKYTSLPPQLVATRALRAKHFLLASVCTIALLANLLAVALSSVFQDVEVPRSREIEFEQPYQPLLTSIQLPWNVGGTPFRLSQPLDHYYVLKSNFTDAAPLPPWTTRDLYFLPFTTKSDVTRDDVRHQAITQAFGISSTCQTLASSVTTSSDLKLHLNKDWSLNFTADSSTATDQTTCIALSLTDRVGYPQVLDSRQSSLESIHYFPNCSNTVFIADWFRHNDTSYDSSPFAALHTSLDYLMLSCEAKARTAKYLTTVNTAQQVIAAEQVSAFEYDLDPYINYKTNLSTIFKDLNQYVSSAGQGEQPVWHTDAYAQEYFNAILKLVLNGSNVDPSSSLPPPSVLAPLVEDLYTRIFAILLGLSPTSFAENAPARRITGKVLFNESGIIMDPVMTVLAISILSLNLIVVIVLYSKQPGRWLPKMPMTIADVWTIVGSSWEIGKELDHKKSHLGQDEKEVALWGYGKFLGRDGSCKVGIERWPFVTPLTADDFDDQSKTRGTKNRLLPWLKMRFPKWAHRQSDNTAIISLDNLGNDATSRSTTLQDFSQGRPSYFWSPVNSGVSSLESLDLKNVKDSQGDWSFSDLDSAVDIGTLSGYTLDAFS